MGLQSDSSAQTVSLNVLRVALVVLLAAIFIVVGVLLIRSETQKQDVLLHDQVLEVLHNTREALASRI
jgi:hypothetical protein